MPPKNEAGAAVARTFNANVRRVAESFQDESGDQYVFLCECGCGTPLTLALAVFVVSGAWVAGHPEQG